MSDVESSVTSADAPDDDRLLTGRFALLWLCGWTYFLAIGAVGPLLPRFVKGPLGYNDVVLGAIIAVFAISAIAVRPTAGRLANRRGRRSVTTVGAAMTAVSHVLLAVPTLAVVGPARLLTGAGQALYFTGAATMVSELAPAHRRGEAVSYFSIAVYLGTGAGPSIGEWIASEWSIGTGFVVAGLLSALATVTTLFLAETRPPTSEPAEDGPSQLFSRVALLPGVVLGLGMVANVAFMSFMPLHADELGMNGAAKVYLLYSAVVIPVRLFGARLPDVLGPTRCGTFATVVIAVGLAVIGAADGPGGLYVGAATLALGISFLYPSLMILVLGRTSDHDRSSAVATLTMFFDIAAGFGGTTLGLVAGTAGYRAAFGTAALSALCALAVLRLVVLKEDRPEEPALAV